MHNFSRTFELHGGPFNRGKELGFEKFSGEISGKDCRDPVMRIEAQRLQDIPLRFLDAAEPSENARVETQGLDQARVDLERLAQALER